MIGPLVQTSADRGAGTVEGADEELRGENSGTAGAGAATIVTPMQENRQGCEPALVCQSTVFASVPTGVA